MRNHSRVCYIIFKSQKSLINSSSPCTATIYDTVSSYMLYKLRLRVHWQRIIRMLQNQKFLREVFRIQRGSTAFILVGREAHPERSSAASTAFWTRFLKIFGVCCFLMNDEVKLVYYSIAWTVSSRQGQRD